MERKEFIETIYDLVILVFALVAWVICVITVSIVIPMADLAVADNSFVDIGLAAVLIFGLCYALIRIFKIAFELEEPEEIE